MECIFKMRIFHDTRAGKVKVALKLVYLFDIYLSWVIKAYFN